MKHSAQLTSLIRELCSAANIKMKDIDAIAISDGPGSYTGLRVGASTAKGICLALNKPLIAISTLKALAHEYIAQGERVMSTIDARRMEAYGAVFCKEESFETKSWIWSEEIALGLSSEYSQLIICGNGIEKGKGFFEQYKNVDLRPSKCSASHLVPLAYQKYKASEFVNVAYHDPFYFKSPNITKSKKRLI